MTLHQLQAMQAANAFCPSPRIDQLGDLHVPFDELLGTRTCEHALDRALRHRHRVALVGASGTGKSSVVEHVLGPLVEGLAPMRIPISMERPQIATDPVEFSRHLVTQIQHWIRSTQPTRDSRARQITGTNPSQRTQKFSIAPAWMEARVELAYELKQATAETPQTAFQTMEQARQLIELCASDDLTPVIVLDDTDRWLSTSWQPDGQAVRGAFFGRVVRVLAEELNTAAIVAVHPTYLNDPDYQAANGFLDTTLTVPALPNPAAATNILQRRAAIALGTNIDANDIIDTPATVTIFTRYTQTPNVRKHLVLIANAALTIAVDDHADTITEIHAQAAIAQEAAEGP